MGFGNGVGDASSPPPPPPPSSSINAMLQAQSQIYHHVMGIRGSFALKCALELEIPDAIHAHGHPVTIPHLISKLDIPPVKAPHLRRLMQLLAQMGYFQLDGDRESYSLTPLSELLLKDSPTSIRPCVVGLLLSPHVLSLGQHMSGWLRSSDEFGCVQEFAHGKSMWDMANESAEFNLMVNETMAGDTRLVVGAVVESCRGVFDGLTSVVDVGGGTGTVARALKKAFPGLTSCAFYDLPHVIAAATESPGVEGIGGDMFEHVPKADAVLLRAILHDWSDEDCVRILKKCKEAIPKKDGKVIIIEIVVEDSKDSKEIETQLLYDIVMMMSTHGKERKEHEWNKLFMEAGFTHYRITPLGLRALIEVFP